MIDKLKLSKNTFIMLGGALIILIFFSVIFISNRPASNQESVKTGKISEVILENETTKLKIKRNGLVKVSNKNRVFFQYWDKDRVDKLFALLESTDFSGFGSRLSGGEDGYLLTLKTDQGTITIAIAADSQLIPEAVVELIEIFENLEEVLENLPETFVSGEPGATESPFPLQSTFPSPTPTPLPAASLPPVPTIGPSPTSSPGQPIGGGGSNINPLIPFTCDYTGQTQGVYRLSETICDLEQ